MTYQERIALGIQNEVIQLAHSLSADHPKMQANTVLIISYLGLNLTPQQVVEYINIDTTLGNVQRIKSRYSSLVATLQQETHNLYSAASLII